MEKMLDGMRANPRDWSIQDILALAARHELRVRRRSGSHVIISFLDGGDISIPAH